MTGTDVSDAKRVYRTGKSEEFPGTLLVELQKKSSLRYGENPNQPAAVYKFRKSSISEFTDIRLVKSGKGGLSATNLMDVTRALDILKFFKAPSVAVMKHLIPSGFATQYRKERLAKTYRLARDADFRSAFGSMVVFNTKVDVQTAKAIMERYVEGVAAPGFEEQALIVFGQKKDLRVIEFSNLDKLPKFIDDDTRGLFDMKVLPTGRVIVQKPYLSSIRSESDSIIDPMVKNKERKAITVKKRPTKNQMRDLLTAWYVNLGVRSNGIVFVKNGVTIAVGSGQQERVGAIEQAIIKAYQKAMDKEKIKYNPLKGISQMKKLKNNPLKGAVVSSDGFFPFRDSIDLLAKIGVTAIIQPGGSIKDFEVIQAVNDNKMAMVYTLERCFGHF
ncbi:MAG: IMP cyclohydrolase [Nanoarchaeota archaeon]|nr:IMP cyclohydrolase [Nanoarchaeota archaeon]